MIAKRSQLRLETPEGISFSIPLAGPFIRGLAVIVDTGIIVVLSMVIGYVVNALALITPDFASALNSIIALALVSAYFIASEWFWRGQTIGKRLFRLRVVDVEGLHLRFQQVVLRTLLRVVDMMPVFYLVGGIASWISPRSQRLGDLAASTVVTYVPEIFEPDLAKLEAVRYNSFRRYPHLEARLRQKVSPAEAAIAFEALLRRDEIRPPDRMELFRTIAARFEELVEFPEEARIGLTDEQYVRNAVDSIYRKPNAKARRRNRAQADASAGEAAAAQSGGPGAAG